ncbi:helix-turn-helix transcriptional regulator [Saccharopolyspora taberi]|uniref:helix-turn-helix domain-containing protein n=1 Tax=Saccharopolyspora taberi TaxID=60895 RepID=UPI0031D24A38
MRDDWEFGRELQRRREIAGLSKRGLAERSGISEGRIRQLETGIQRVNRENVPARPSAPTVSRVAKALGWDVDDALTLAGLADAPLVPRAGRPSRGDLDDKMTQQMQEIWRQITPEQRDAVLRVMQAMTYSPGLTLHSTASTSTDMEDHVDMPDADEPTYERDGTSADS